MGTYRISAQEIHYFGRNWNPGMLKDEPPEKPVDYRRYNTLVNRTVSPTATTMGTVQLLADCPDRDEHLRRDDELSASGKICEGCEMSPPIIGKTQTFVPPRICDHHRRHEHCNPRRQRTLHNPEDSVFDDDGTQLQGGIITDFTHPSADKLRLGWAKSPQEERNIANEHIRKMNRHISAARQLGDRALRRYEEGLDTTEALNKMEENLTKAADDENPRDPAYDYRHSELRGQLQEERKRLQEIRKSQADL